MPFLDAAAARSVPEADMHHARMFDVPQSTATQSAVIIFASMTKLRSTGYDNAAINDKSLACHGFGRFRGEKQNSINHILGIKRLFEALAI